MDPINRQPPIDRDELRQNLRLLLENYENEELLDRLTEFVMFSSIEVLLIKDPRPDILGRLDDEKVETIRRLNP